MFVRVNAYAVFLFSILHPFSHSIHDTSPLKAITHSFVVGAEIALLFLPALASALWARHSRFNHRGMIGPAGMAVSLAMLTTAIYGIDLFILFFQREHLLAPTFIKLAWSVLPFMYLYITPAHVAYSAIALGAFMAVEFGTWRMTAIIRRTPRHTRLQRWAPTAVGTALLAAAWSGLALNWNNTERSFINAPDRHPITATGLFPSNRTPKYTRDSETLRFGALKLITRHQEQKDLLKRYRQLRVETKLAGDPRKPPLPDIVIVISECLRPEAISKKTTPNLHRLSQRGLHLTQHFSTGNASNFGFFGIMFGLDACWFEQAGNLPIGMLDGLRQVGYQTGFFGEDTFNTYGMETFCGPERFDHSGFIRPSRNTATDKQVVTLAKEFFDRGPRYPDPERQPRIAIVYFYGPHNSYSDQQDRIHTLEDTLAFQSTTNQSRQLKYKRYMDSVRCMDRLIAPLLTPERMVWVMGDHGESFGEDGRSRHGTALSEVQVRTACVAAGPGIPHRRIDLPTGHADIWPTVADACGLTLSDPQIVAGRSLRPLHITPRPLSIRALSPPHHLFIDSRAHTPSNAFAYLGLLNRERYVLTPGDWVDRNADGLSLADHKAGSWTEAAPLRAWLEDRFGAEMARTDEKADTMVRAALRSESPEVRRAAERFAGSVDNFKWIKN